MNMQQRGGLGGMNMQQHGGPGIGSGAMWTTLPCFLSHSVLTSSSISTPSIWHVQPIDAHTHMCLKLMFESSAAWGSTNSTSFASVVRGRCGLPLCLLAD
jgi:hypothetical protein